MSELVQIEYRGYAIHFSENQEVWRCLALDIAGERIGAVKRKIDKIIAASRKIPINFDALHADYHNSVTKVRIVAFAQPRRGLTEPNAVWCMCPGSERYYDRESRTHKTREVEVRKKLDLANIYADSPENRDAFAEIERLQSEQARITLAIKRVREGATRMSLADLKMDEVEDE